MVSSKTPSDSKLAEAIRELHVRKPGLSIATVLSMVKNENEWLVSRSRVKKVLTSEGLRASQTAAAASASTAALWKPSLTGMPAEILTRILYFVYQGTVHVNIDACELHTCSDHKDTWKPEHGCKIRGFKIHCIRHCTCELSHRDTVIDAKDFPTTVNGIKTAQTKFQASATTSELPSDLTTRFNLHVPANCSTCKSKRFDKAHEALPLAVLYTCRKIYQAGRLMPYSVPKYSLSSLNCLHTFTSLVLKPDQAAAVKQIQLDFWFELTMREREFDTIDQRPYITDPTFHRYLLGLKQLHVIMRIYDDTLWYDLECPPFEHSLCLNLWAWFEEYRRLLTFRKCLALKDVDVTVVRDMREWKRFADSMSPDCTLSRCKGPHVLQKDMQNLAELTKAEILNKSIVDMICRRGHTHQKESRVLTTHL